MIMKKQIKPLLCFLLILSILCADIGCFADCGKAEPVYVSLGDSIADGIGLPANPQKGPTRGDKNFLYCHKTEGAYPVLIARKLGILDSNFYQLGCGSMRTVELRRCLDSSYTMPNHDTLNFQNGELEEYVLSRYNYVDLCSRADIITLNMGANDIATYALLHVRSAMACGGVSDAIIDKIAGCEIRCGEYFGALAKLLEYASKLEMFSRVVSAAIRGLSEGYATWTKNWDAICRKIYALNPDVTLVCIGMYNPFATMKLTRKSLVQVGAALDGIVAAIDSWSAAGSAYAKKYTYVSIMGIESIFAEHGTSFTDSDFLNSLELDVHPSAKGQQQIADRVVRAVEKTDFCKPVQLIVDIGKKYVAAASRAGTVGVYIFNSIIKR